MLFILGSTDTLCLFTKLFFMYCITSFVWRSYKYKHIA